MTAPRLLGLVGHLDVLEYAEYTLVALIVVGACAWLVRRFLREPERACGRCEAAEPPAPASGVRSAALHVLGRPRS